MTTAARLGALALAVSNTRADAAAHGEAMRIAEALLFAAPEPLDTATLAGRLPPGVDPAAVLADLQRFYERRGINLVGHGDRWSFRTAPDVSGALVLPDERRQKPSRAALEVLAIVAYHQPATRAEIEAIRGVSTSKGTLDTLLEAGWVRLRGRRQSPGRPITYGTTASFLDHFGLAEIGDLPGLDELKGLGLVEGRAGEGRLPPAPSDDEALAPDEEPFDPDALAFAPGEDAE